MIRIEQVRLLEQRVQKVITRITELQTENTTLRRQLQNYEDRIADLETRIEGFASSQDEIEAGILNALQRLDEVEDAVAEENAEQHSVDIQEEPRNQEALPESEHDTTGETTAGAAGDDEPEHNESSHDIFGDSEPGDTDPGDNDTGDSDTDDSDAHDCDNPTASPNYDDAHEDGTGEPKPSGPELDIF